MLEHFFRDLKVGDDTVFQRPDGSDIARSAPKHALGFDTHRFNGFLTVGQGANGNHRGLIEDDTLLPDIDERVRRAQVDR